MNLVRPAAPTASIHGSQLVNAITFRAALFFLATVLCAATTHAVTYTATLLHLPVFDDSFGHDVSGSTQVGSGRGPSTDGNSHALLWRGTAASAVDLHPPEFLSSIAAAVSGANQVGYGSLELDSVATIALSCRTARRQAP